MSTIANQLKADPTGDVALRLFTSHIHELFEDGAIDQTTMLKLMRWQTRSPLSWRDAGLLALQQKTYLEMQSTLFRAYLADAKLSAKAKGKWPRHQNAAVKAFMFDRYLHLPLPNLTNRFCECGKPQHTKVCETALRKAKAQLRRELSKLNIEFPK